MDVFPAPPEVIVIEDDDDVPHYLGMNIDVSTPGDISFDMIPYITKILQDFHEKITVVASSPAADHLFKIHAPTDVRLLLEFLESQAIAYHHTDALLIFLS